MNDSPVDCQNVSVTEPQRETRLSMPCGNVIFSSKVEGIVFLFALNEVEILLFFRTVEDACPYKFFIHKVGARIARPLFTCPLTNGRPMVAPTFFGNPNRTHVPTNFALTR